MATISLVGSSEENVEVRDITTTKVVTIRLIRAKFFNILPGTKNGIAETRIPFDIDDLEVDDNTVKNNTIEGIATIATENNALNWENAGGSDYLGLIRDYTQSLRARIVDETKKAATEVEGDLDVFDITSSTKIQSISRKLGEPPIAILNMSLLELRKRNEEVKFMPRENDVVEIRLKYPDKATTIRTFIGLVTSITANEAYGTVTHLVLECAGLMKMLMIHKMVADRAIISRFEEGELLQPEITPWSTGRYAANTVDEIFTSIMISQLAMKVKASDTQTQSTSDRFSVLNSEETTISISLDRLKAERRSLIIDINTFDPIISTQTQKNSDVVIAALDDDKVFETSLTEFQPGGTFKSRVVKKSMNDLVRDIGSKEEGRQLGFVSIDDLKKEVGGPTRDDKPPSVLEEHGPEFDIFKISNAAETQEEIDRRKELAKNLLVVKVLQERVLVISTSRKAIRDQEIKRIKKGEFATGFKESKIDFEFDLDAITTSIGFQLLYTPLINMMLYRRGKEEPLTAKFRGRQLNAFDLLIRKGFRIFFSAMGTPRSILENVESTAKFVVYEDEEGTIHCEIPQYNNFAVQDNDSDIEPEKIKDFIIANPISMRFTRQDASLITRKDVQRYFPGVGELTAGGTTTTRQYTDIAALSRYGMRATEPVYNPNGLDDFTTASWAAIEVTYANASTRTLTVTVDGNKAYKIGRLYFIARNSIEKEAGTEVESASQFVNTDGYVGYLTDNNMRIDHGNAITNELHFMYVRKARLIKKEDETDLNKSIKANFRLLPDVNGLIRAYAKAIQNGDVSPQANEIEETRNITEDPAELVNTGVENQGLVYVANIKNILPKERVALDDFHHADLPPSLDEVSGRPPIKTNNKIAVLRLEPDNHGLSRKLVAGLSLLDMRLRVISPILFRTAKKISLPFVPLARKAELFKMIFIPPATVNPLARFDDLKGMKLTLLTNIGKGVNQGLPTATTGVVTKLPSDTGLIGETVNTILAELSSLNSIFFSSIIKEILVAVLNKSIGTQPVPGIFLHGFPVRVDAFGNIPVKKTFALLRGSPPLRLAGNWELEPGSKVVNVTPVSIQRIAFGNEKEAIISHLRDIEDIDDAEDQFNAAVGPFIIGRGGDVQTPSAFVPVVFNELDSTATLNNYIPGANPMTLLDTSRLADSLSRFIGNQVSSKTNKASAHKAGKAMDITLAPYFSFTGIVSTKTFFTNDGILPSGLLARASQPLVGFETLDELVAKAAIVGELKDSDTVKNALNSSILAASRNAMDLEDLASGDQGYRHIDELSEELTDKLGT